MHLPGGTLEMIHQLKWQASFDENCRCFYAASLARQGEHRPCIVLLGKEEQLPDFTGKPPEMPGPLYCAPILESRLSRFRAGHLLMLPRTSWASR